MPALQQLGPWPLAVATVLVALLLHALARRQWRQERERLGAELAAQRESCTELQVALSGARERISLLDSLKRDLVERDQLLDSLRAEQTDLTAQLREQRVRLQSERQAQAEKLQLLEQARSQMQEEFQQLARRVLEENSQRFGHVQQEKLDHLLSPLRQQLGDFRRRVDDVYDRENRDRAGLKEQIHQLKQLNLQMSRDAVNLTQALKGDSKVQGNWGEVVLERILEESGLRRGYEYELQVHQRDEAGRRYLPDVIVHLPEDKDVIIDAKVSLVAYERYCSAEDAALAAEARKAHLLSLRRHIKGLSEKAYQQLPGIRSLDFVLLFIPLEPAFTLALEEDPALFGDAFERNILLVSPSSLLVTLRTINHIWRYEKQNSNAQEIARRGAELHDKFVGFVEALDDVGRHLGQTQQAFDAAYKRLSRGRGNLVSRVTALQQLGVAGKKQLSKRLTEQARESAEAPGDA
ncbi:DNA recombination protein RmuC [Motiliproteus sp. SC1-56]|uniref:DNA recombination protein RmuC n=1 Tax=Motiliproteus sp. SC1-56 TaxID=2799565 RepID=UPI001A8C3C09|nr:DNA recombination protein RmuC [Motiliproteus sp. SC1-56]